MTYPSKLNKLECTDKIETVDLSQVQVHGRYTSPDSSWHRLPGLKIKLGSVMAEQCEGDFDGFSGGPGQPQPRWR